MTTCTCGRPTNGVTLCDQCRVTLAHAITNIGIYWFDLDTVANRATRYGTGAASKGSIGKTQPLPVDMRFVNQQIRDDQAPGPRGAHLAPGAQLRRDAETTTAHWAHTIAIERPTIAGPACPALCTHTSCDDIRRAARPRPTVPARLLYIARHHRHAITRDWAPAMLAQLADLEHRLSRMVDRPADRWYAGRCSATDDSGNECTSELYARTDRGTIICPACGTQHDVAARRDFLLDQAAEIAVTATEAASALIAWTDYDGSTRKLVDRIRKWRDREDLEVLDVTSLHGRDRHLYRLGDIQTLLAKSARDTQHRTIGA